MATDLRRLTPEADRPAPHAAAIQRFDEWAATYDMCALQPAYRAAHRSLMNIAVTLAPPPQRILDVGCGTGILPRALHTTMPHASVVGVDASFPMLHVAAAHGADVGWVRASAEQLPFADATFDLVTASFTARHWSDVPKAAAEAARILAPGGMLAIADAFTQPRSGTVADFLRRAPKIPEPLRTALPEAGLGRPTAWTIDGYGPIPAITVITAVRQPTDSPTVTLTVNRT